ncbi:hypothetical protein HDV63DRAFT_43613 [Trichoderma sp. SZMC 28014]
MPTRTRKRKASEEDDATPEIIPAAKKTSRTTQRGSQGQSSKAKTSSKNGRSRTSGNLNSERASKSSKSTASSVSSAKRDIQRKADKLLHLIETQVEDGPSTLGSGPAAAELKTAPLRKDMIDLEHDSTSRGTNAVYEGSCKLLQDLQEAVDEYKRLNNAKTNLAKFTEMAQWEEDLKNITQVDTRAMEIAVDMLNGIVLGDKKAEPHRSSARPVDEVEQAARRWLQIEVPLRGDTWGDAAREVLCALSGVAKILS